MPDIIQSWALKGRELYASVYSERELNKFDEFTEAEQEGYYFTDNGKKIVQVELFRAELHKATKEYKEWFEKLKTNRPFEASSEKGNRFYVINNRLCCIDEDHCGQVYVPKRCILADPVFYNIEDWDEVTMDYLLNEEGFSIEDLDSQESSELLESVISRIEYLSKQFSERMMTRTLHWMCYVGLDSAFIDFVGDYDLLKWARIKPQDIHPISDWHDD